jgi:hypothetical protein
MTLCGLTIDMGASKAPRQPRNPWALLRTALAGFTSSARQRLVSRGFALGDPGMLAVQQVHPRAEHNYRRAAGDFLRGPRLPPITTTEVRGASTHLLNVQSFCCAPMFWISAKQLQSVTLLCYPARCQVFGELKSGLPNVDVEYALPGHTTLPIGRRAAPPVNADELRSHNWVASRIKLPSPCLSDIILENQVRN